MVNIIRRWQPLSSHHYTKNPFLPVQQELDKVMSDFNHWFGMQSFQKDQLENLSLLPAVDIVDDNNVFKVEMEMPGMGEEDIKVLICDGVLTVKGDKTTSKQDKDKNYLMREISYGSYERSIPLPDSADISKASASFKKGMLWVTIPKRMDSLKENRELKIEKM